MAGGQHVLEGEAPTLVVHGATAGTARPAGATLVQWRGTVAPTHAVTNDEWYDQASDLLKRWSGTAWKAAGSATYAPVSTPAGNATADAAQQALDYLGSNPSGSHQTVQDRINAIQTRGGRFTATNWYQLNWSTTGTSATLGNGTFRSQYVDIAEPVVITKIAADVTAAGDAGCTLRIGIYADSNGAPGLLYVDAGTVPADAIATPTVTTNITLPPGRYYFGAAVQGVTVTQPTVRTIGTVTLDGPVFAGTAQPAAGAAAPVGWSAGAITAALPQTWTASAATAGTAPRLTVKTGARPKLPQTPLRWKISSQKFNVLGVGIDGKVYGTGNTDKILQRSSDGLATFETGVDLAGTIAAGESVIYAANTSAGYVVITTGATNSGANAAHIYFSATFTGPYTLVQTLGTTTSDFTISPLYTVSGATQFAVGEYTTVTPSSSRSWWLTRDGGQTWHAVKSSNAGNTAHNSHFHGSAFDASRNRWWVSQGDLDNARWSFSDDVYTSNTPTWTDAAFSTTDPLYDGTNVYPQPTAVVAWAGTLAGTPDRGVTGLPGGVWTMDPTTGVSPHVAFVLPNGESTSAQFARAPYVLSGNEAIFAYPDSGSGSNKVYFVGTGDAGASWHLLNTLSTGGATANRGVYGPDSLGNLYYKPYGFPNGIGDFTLVAVNPAWA